MRVIFATSLALSSLLFVSGRAIEPEIDDSSVTLNLDLPHVPARADPRMTNAKRLAMGRPLRRPKQIRDAQVGVDTENLLADSETPTTNGQPDCNTARLSLQDSNAQFLGYIAAPLDNSGLFSTLVQSKNDPNVLTICLYPTDKGSGLADMTDLSSVGNSTVSYVGAVVAPGSDPSLDAPRGDYIYLGLVGQTYPGSPPMGDPDSTGTSYNEATGSRRPYESNIWATEEDVNPLLMVWTETDAATTKTLSWGMLPNGEIIGTSDASNLRARGVVFQDVILGYADGH